jgi:hypothetical protein
MNIWLVSCERGNTTGASENVGMRVMRVMCINRSPKYDFVNDHDRAMRREVSNHVGCQKDGRSGAHYNTSPWVCYSRVHLVEQLAFIQKVMCT